MSATGDMTCPIDPWLLSILVCPVSRSPLRYDPQAQELVSIAAGLAFPVRNGVPVMIIEQARTLTDAS